MSNSLHERATELGVETSYRDVDGIVQHADDTVVEHVVAILDADRAHVAGVRRLGEPLHLAGAGPYLVSAHVDHAAISIDGRPVDTAVRHGDDHDSIDLPVDLPVGCHTLEFSAGSDAGGTIVVVAPPLMPRSERFAGGGTLFVPTYALWERDRPLPSFAHLHELARTLHQQGIDVVSTLPLYATFLADPLDPSPYSPVSRLHWNEVYLDDTTLPEASVPPLGDTVDWSALGRRRRQQLLSAANELDDTERDDLASFVAANPDVGSYARFRAEREGDGDEVVERSHVLAQYLASRQLGAIRDDPDAAALALDLPVGSHPDGFEVWSDPSMFAAGVSVGAPPDSFFADGQSWGFPPPLPAAMHASGQRLWRRLIGCAGRQADILRLDHAMAVERLWWVPDGFSARHGVYVRYAREEILAVIAATAAETGLTVVGEDLGTVPPDVSDAFERWDMLGMYEEQFHLDDAPLPHIPARTVAGIRTHDMEPLAAHLATHDTAGYRQRLAAMDGTDTDLDDSWDDVVEHMLRRLADSDAYLVVADLDDLIGETRPHNLPGRVAEGLWSRRLGRPTSEILDDPDVRRRLTILGRNTS